MEIEASTAADRLDWHDLRRKHRERLCHNIRKSEFARASGAFHAMATPVAGTIGRHKESIPKGSICGGVDAITMKFLLTG
jgi:hypothetical protein